jgi:hypothetical protein
LANTDSKVLFLVILSGESLDDIHGAPCSAFAAEHLSSFFGSHPCPETHFSEPFNFAPAGIFHDISPVEKLRLLIVFLEQIHSIFFDYQKLYEQHYNVFCCCFKTPIVNCSRDF